MEGPAKGPKPGVLNTLPERIALARREGLDYADFLQIVLGDEVSRRDHGRLELRQRQAGFEQLCRLEDFDWSAQVRLDRRFVAADQYFREMAQARVDHSTEKDVPRLPRPELLDSSATSGHSRAQRRPGLQPGDTGEVGKRLGVVGRRKGVSGCGSEPAPNSGSVEGAVRGRRGLTGWAYAPACAGMSVARCAPRDTAPT